MAESCKSFDCRCFCCFRAVDDGTREVLNPWQLMEEDRLVRSAPVTMRLKNLMAMIAAAAAAVVVVVMNN